MANLDSDSKAPKGIEHLSFLLIGTGDLNMALGQDPGQSTHADSTDTHEMNRAHTMTCKETGIAHRQRSCTRSVMRSALSSLARCRENSAMR